MVHLLVQQVVLVELVELVLLVVSAPPTQPLPATSGGAAEAPPSVSPPPA